MARARRRRRAFVPGLFAVHGDLGNLPMHRVAEPAIRAAREGVPILPMQAYIATIVAPILMASAPARACSRRAGRCRQAGDVFANPIWRQPLPRWPISGPDYFVDGRWPGDDGAI